MSSVMECTASGSAKVSLQPVKKRALGSDKTQVLRLDRSLEKQWLRLRTECTAPHFVPERPATTCVHFSPARVFTPLTATVNLTLPFSKWWTLHHPGHGTKFGSSNSPFDKVECGTRAGVFLLVYNAVPSSSTRGFFLSLVILQWAYPNFSIALGPQTPISVGHATLLSLTLLLVK